jgi:hypothetical protein
MEGIQFVVDDNNTEEKLIDNIYNKRKNVLVCIKSNPK